MNETTRKLKEVLNEIENYEDRVFEDTQEIEYLKNQLAITKKALKERDAKIHMLEVKNQNLLHYNDAYQEELEEYRQQQDLKRNKELDRVEIAREELKKSISNSIKEVTEYAQLLKKLGENNEN